MDWKKASKKELGALGFYRIPGLPFVGFWGRFIMILFGILIILSGRHIYGVVILALGLLAMISYHFRVRVRLQRLIKNLGPALLSNKSSLVIGITNKGFVLKLNSELTDADLYLRFEWVAVYDPARHSNLGFEIPI